MTILTHTHGNAAGLGLDVACLNVELLHLLKALGILLEKVFE